MYQMTANIMWFSLVPGPRVNGGAPGFVYAFNLLRMWVVRIIF